MVAAIALLALLGTEPGNRVLLIGIDGCRPDALAAARTPTIDRLAEDGVLLDKVRIAPTGDNPADTLSGPGWSSILTGVWADKHGVEDNSFSTPALERYPSLFTRLRRTKPKARTVSAVSWSVINRLIVTDPKAQRRVGKKKGRGYSQADTGVVRIAASAIVRSNPELVFVHLGSVDAAGHEHDFDPKSRKYRAAIERSDAHVGTLVRAVRARRTHDDENWLVIVCTDHGGIGRHHGKGAGKPEIEEVFLVLSGPGVKERSSSSAATIVDIAPTALAHLGVSTRPEWHMDGRDLLTPVKVDVADLSVEPE